MQALMIWIIAQTPPPFDPDGILQGVVEAQEVLGGINPTTQQIASVSVLIGVVLLIFVYEFRNWRRRDKDAEYYTTRLGDLEGDLFTANNELDTLRQERRDRLDILAECHRVVAFRDSEIETKDGVIKDLRQLVDRLQYELQECLDTPLTNTSKK